MAFQLVHGFQIEPYFMCHSALPNMDHLRWCDVIDDNELSIIVVIVPITCLLSISIVQAFIVPLAYPSTPHKQKARLMCSFQMDQFLSSRGSTNFSTLAPSLAGSFKMVGGAIDCVPELAGAALGSAIRIWADWFWCIWCLYKDVEYKYYLAFQFNDRPGPITLCYRCSVAGGLSQHFFDKLNKLAKNLKIFMEIDLIKYYHLIFFS